MTDDTLKIKKHSLSQTYSIPELYDIAFDFRDVPAEVDFLLDTAAVHLGRPVTSALELACGPAYHTREMARRGLKSDGLDLGPEMAAYTRRLIDDEKLKAEIFEGDMRTFTSPQKYDLVYILMASYAHLHTNQGIIDNLNCTADLLTDGGIYIISTAHPRDFFQEEPNFTETSWTMSRGDITVETNWGGDHQQFDPLTEIDDVTVIFDVTTPEGKVRHEFPEQLRRLSMNTFLALVQLNGRFEIKDLFGGLEPGLKLNNDRKCWRLVPIMKKTK